MSQEVDATAERLASSALRVGVPPHLIGGLVRYIKDKIPTGSFLRCVLEKDMEGARNRGDIVSLASIDAILQFLHNHAPKESWGSVENVEAWLKSRTK